MSVELRPCGLQGWAVCEGNCEECGTTATTTTDGYWYHGNGKIGGEFHPAKPNDEEHYGEYVKVVRCKDCMHWDNHDGGERCLNEIYLSWAKPNNFCIYGVKKDEVEEC